MNTNKVETVAPQLVSEGDVLVWGEELRVVTEVLWFEVARVGRVYRFWCTDLAGNPVERVDVRARGQVEVVFA
ncbi:hypothetical protein SEA_GHOBES_46 [Gordonia phage Ghobes]|uniref:Uncharacterized protein n=1 Tax=Gordonia phage Ghobes TaxID=1887647 RepID=A0A1B3B054_9CAUD|nr:hypothetical protein KCH37_gp46 [Gordonia phage Ghobes]AOE44397.1 hypothetical protein SEA_GHOBES_46 [Gordonia phage Ghobes]